MQNQYYIGRTSLNMEKGDLLACKSVIVNPTDGMLSGLGGLDKLIHQSAGPRLDACCKDKCGFQVGDTVLTPGYELKCPYIIHVVGPRWFGKPQDEALLEKCYKNILMTAIRYEIRHISIPAISTGEKGFPEEIAARVAIRTCVEFAKKYRDNVNIDGITWILNSDESLAIYERVAEEIIMQDMNSEEYLLANLDPERIRYNIDFFAAHRDKVEWKGGKNENGVNTFAYPAYPAGMDFVIMDMDYEYNATMKEIEIAGLTPSELNLRQIKGYLTYIWRGERFCDGHIAEYMENGVLLKLFLRLDDLYQRYERENAELFDDKKNAKSLLHECAVCIWNDLMNETPKMIWRFKMLTEKIVEAASTHGICLNALQIENAFWRKSYLRYEKNTNVNQVGTHVCGRVCLSNVSGHGHPNGEPVMTPQGLENFLPHLEKLLADIYEFENEEIFTSLKNYR